MFDMFFSVKFLHGTTVKLTVVSVTVLLSIKEMHYNNMSQFYWFYHVSDKISAVFVSIGNISKTFFKNPKTFEW